MKISVVVPTKNAGLAFSDVLDAIRRQELEHELEIVVVDSGSQDGTQRRAEHAGAVFWEIPPENFNHGRTRNLGVRVATGDLVALLTQDACPADPLWLGYLVAAFDDPRVAGAYSRVMPREDASPLVKRCVERDLVFSEDHLYKTIEDLEAFERAHPFEQRVHAHFNNVASCVRRSVIETIPFPAMPFGEDLAWGLEVMRAGHALVYEPRSVVVHSHGSSLPGDFLRHKADATLMRRLFGLRNRRGPIDAVRAWGREVGCDFRYLRRYPRRQRIRWGTLSLGLRAAQILGQCCGSVGRRGPRREGLEGRGG